MIDQNTDLSQDEVKSKSSNVIYVNHEQLDRQSMDRHEQSIQLRNIAAYVAISVAMFLVLFAILFFGQMLTNKSFNSEFIPYAIGFMLSMLIAGVTTIILLVKSAFSSSAKEDIGVIQSIPSASVIIDLLKSVKEIFTKK